jgi:DcuC family C4-dicarboxylate transporter
MAVLIATLLVVVLAGVLLVRGRDIRMVLFLAAAAMYALRAMHPDAAGQRWNLFGNYFLEFARGMTKPESVVPICTAMGFAYVCKFTRCDAHLVHLLVSPLRYLRPLMIPGGIAVAFIVNSAIVSQTSTVAVVGPVLIPLLLAGGVSKRTAGALLLLGGSMGGELLNPAAVEVTAIKLLMMKHSGAAVDATAVVARVLPYNLIASAAALGAFWVMSRRWQRLDAMVAGEIVKDEATTPAARAGTIAAMMDASHAEPLDRIHPIKALIPLVPIMLLLFVKPHIPLPKAFVSSDSNTMAEQAAIAAAMIIGAAAAAMAALNNLDGIAAAFFEGAGFTFVHVIPVIAGATMFAQGIEINGLMQRLAAALSHAPAVIAPASIAIGWLMAMVTGTAVGTAPLVINIMYPIAAGAAPASLSLAAGTRAGALAAVAAQFGRTSSPLAPVTMMCAVLSRERPMALVARVLPPLLVGAIVMLIVAMVWR